MANDPTIPLKELENRFKQVYKRLPRVAGNVVVNFALENFRRQGFLGDSFKPWKPRKKVNKWGQKIKRSGRAILVDKGILRRGTRIIRANANEVVVGNSVPYAKAHNDGLRQGQIQHVKPYVRKISTVARVTSLKTKRTTARRVSAGTQQVRAHTRRIDQNIPARPFLKDSPFLRRKLQRELAAEILKALKP